jgi:hypothetical protein
MLFLGGFHWIGSLAILYVWRSTPTFVSRPWRVASAVAGAHVVAFSLFGGAVLERYLLPVLPILYAAMAVAFAGLPGKWRIAAPAAALAGILAANFIDPPYRYPLENNLAFREFVDLQQTAAQFIESTHPTARVITVWPLSAALRNPDLGYVRRPLLVRQLPYLSLGIPLEAGEILVAFNFDREWRPLPLAGFARSLSRRLYGYREPLAPFVLASRLQLMARWSRGGHWIEIYGGRSDSAF